MKLYFGILLIFCEYFGSYDFKWYGTHFVCFRDYENYFDCDKPSKVKSKELITAKGDSFVITFKKTSKPFQSIRSGAFKILPYALLKNKLFVLNFKKLNFIKINKNSFDNLQKTYSIMINDNFTEIDRTAFLNWSKMNDRGTAKPKLIIYVPTERYLIKELIFGSNNWAIQLERSKYSLWCHKGAFVQHQFQEIYYTIKFEKGLHVNKKKHKFNFRTTGNSNCSTDLIITCNQSILSKVSVTPQSEIASLKCENSTKLHLLLMKSSNAVESIKVDFQSWTLTKLNSASNMKCFKRAFINSNYKSKAFTIQFTKSTSNNTEWMDERNCSDFIKCNKNVPAKACFKEKVPRQIKAGNVSLNANYTNDTGIIKIDCHRQELDGTKLTVELADWNLTLNNCSNTIKCFKGGFINNVYRSDGYTIQFTESAGVVNTEWMDERNCSDFIKCNKNVPAKVCFKEKVPRQIETDSVSLNVNYTNDTGIIKIDCHGQELDNDTKLTIELADWNLTLNNCSNTVKCFKRVNIEQSAYTVEFEDSDELQNTSELNNFNCKNLVENFSGGSSFTIIIVGVSAAIAMVSLIFLILFKFNYFSFNNLFLNISKFF